MNKTSSFFFFFCYDSNLVEKVAMINDFISSCKNQVMRGGIDERNATGQRVLCQIQLMSMVNTKQKSC